MGLQRKKIQIFLFCLLSLGLLSSCSTDKASKGAGLGGSIGAVAGVILDTQKSWRGGVIGGALGAVLVSGVTEISTRVSREAGREGMSVAYQSTDGFQRVEATPLGLGSNPNCRLIREHIYQEGKLVRDEIREVCQ
jgi:hypothetical protein